MPRGGDDAATLAIDTSVAIAHLVRSHTHHRLVRAHLSGRRPCLTTHSLAETYSVLTRLPGDARVTPDDARALITSNFPTVVSLPDETAREIHVVLARCGIAGGAVYDALVGLAARHAGVPLATRDARAAATYAALAVATEIVTG